jgi:hypothetical protein
VRKFLLLLVLTDLLVLASCGDGASSGSTGGGGGGGQGQVTLQSIQINPSSASIAQGTTQAFTATGTYSDGSTKDLTLAAQWSCLLSNLATVSNSSPTQGLAMGVAPGTALITASMGSVSNSGTLSIKGGLNVTSLVVSPATATIGFGTQQQFTATATFSDMSQQDVTNVSSWSVPPLFITSHSGLAIANNVGTGNMVQAIFGGGGSGTATLSVDLSNLVSISVLPAPASIANHTQVRFAAIGTFKDGSTRDISSLATWSSSNPAVATIGSPGGVFKGTGVGTATISAMACTVTDPITQNCIGTILSGSASLNVTGAQLQSIAVFPVNASIAPTTKLGFTAIGVFSDVSTQDLTNQLAWSVLDPSIASVQTAKGIVTGLSAGPTTVTASSSTLLGSIQGSTQINVTSATLTSIALKPANTFIAPGSTLSYSAIGTFTDATIQDISDASSWSSEFQNVATVSSAAATGQGLGQSNMTAKLKSASGTVVSGTTNLKVASPKQISIAAAPATVQMADQTATQLTATGTFVDGSTQDLTSSVNWSSSGPNIATVGAQTGIVSALAPGKSTVTAMLGSVSSTTQVTVTNASLTSITLSPANPSIALGSSQQFTATGNFSDGSIQALLGAAWSSSAPMIAAADNSGLATSTGVGTATVTASLNGVNGNTNVTVH